MKFIRVIFWFAMLSTVSMGCQEKENNPTPTPESQTELLVANKWGLKRVANANDNTISTSQMNATTLLLFELSMQFSKDNTVLARNTKTSQVLNGGTWKLAEDNKSMDVDVNGFKGNFPILALSRTKLTLRQRAPVSGVDTDINLEFEPIL
jgi:hypothetical protein